jgi:MerR family transcriptional regulator, copper efflux regulator
LPNLDTIVVRLAAGPDDPARSLMDALTINEAAATTGWSPRMLRYIERIGLVDAPRSPAGYRLYGAPELQRLRTLRELLGDFDVGLGEMGFARRLRDDPELRGRVDAWFTAEPERPDDVPESDWLRFEQDKHERLLAAAAQLA